MELIALQAKKTVLAFGLSKWAQLDPYKSAHAQVVRWRHEGFTHAVRYPAGAETVYGFTAQALTPEESTRYKGMRLISGAAAAALLPQLRGKTALVTIEVASSVGIDPRVVVIGLERGIVTMDQVVAPDEVSDIRQRFSTDNRKSFPDRIDIELVDGPFRRLDGSWIFLPLGALGCKVQFQLRYEFSSRMLEKLVGPVFEHIATTFVDAFVERAAVVYRPDAQ